MDEHEYFQQRRSYWIKKHQLDWEEAEDMALKDLADLMFRLDQMEQRRAEAAHHQLAGDEVETGESFV